MASLPKRVLMLAWHWNTAGGLERVTSQVAGAWRELGAEVQVWAVLDTVAESLEGVRSVPLAAPGRGRLRKWWFRRVGWRTAVRNRLEVQLAGASRPDVVVIGHVHLLRALPGGGVWPPGWPPGVLWAHGNEVWGPMGARFRGALERLARVVCVSGFTEAEVRRHSPGARTVVVPNPVDTLFFRPATWRGETPGVRRDEVLICGRMAVAERYKGHDVLLTALPRAADRLGRPVRLRVVGEGDDRPRLEQAAAAAGLADRVTFAGRVSSEGLRQAYRECGVFALPSRVIRRPRGHWGGEGLGVVLLEAAACGRPVIASREGGCPEALVPGETGWLVDPCDPEDVARAIAEALGDPARADAMGAAGRRLMEERFSLPVFRRNVAALGTGEC
jgi:glycosyltransferase involved in cell wall biosynthesis